MNYVGSLERLKKRKVKGWVTSGTAALLFAATMLCAIGVLGYTLSRPPNFVVMHAVHVLERLDKQTFRAEVKDPATGEWYPFVLRACPDFEPTHEIERGVTLTLLQYVEDRTRSCMELDGKYAGYILLRDENGNPIRSTFAGPPATSNSTETTDASAPGARAD